MFGLKKRSDQGKIQYICGVDHNNNNNNKNIYFNLFKINFFIIIIIIIIITIIAPVLTNTHSHISLFVAKVATNKIASEIARAHWIHAKEMLQLLVAKYSMRTPIWSHFNFSFKKRKFVFFILFYLILFLYILAYATAIVISGLGPNKTFIFILF